MTIQKANDRLWSCLSSDPKPDHFAPGILLIETDTGIWWISQDDHTWMACYPTLARHQAVEMRVTQAEIEHQVLQEVITNLTAELVATKASLKRVETDIADLKRGR